MSETIYLDAPTLGEIEKEYLLKAVDSGYVSTVGPFVPEFETKFAHYLNTPYCVSTQSGTAALHVALYELGIGPGDEVIVPALTFIATVNAVLYVGATPVIVDVDPETWNMDVTAINSAISPKTKAIIPVHLYGNPCNMDEILKLAKEHHLDVIEDATESLGATINGKYTGTFGVYGCFSFNGNKLITTGGGGMLVTADSQKGQRVKFLVNQARDSSRGYYHPELGFNYRMTNLEAALGLAQFSQLHDFLQLKKETREIYLNVFADFPQVKFQHNFPMTQSSWWLNGFTVAKELDLDLLIKKLAAENIQARRIFVPLGDMPYLSLYKQNCTHADLIYRTGICLPSSTLNSKKAVETAASVIKRIVKEML